MAGGKGSRNKKRSGGKRAGTPSGQVKRPAASPPSGAAGPAPPAAPSAAGAPRAQGAPTRKAADAGPGRVKPTQAERLEAARRARKRKALRVRVGVPLAIALLAGVVFAVVAADRRATKAERDRLTAGSCTFDTENDRLSDEPNNHVAPPSYEVDPPSGGNHAPQDAPAAFYPVDQQPPPPDSRLVHSLEHGYVVLWYRPDLAPKDVEAIRGVFDRYNEDVLVVPRPSLKVKVAATSWGKRLLCAEVEPSRLAEFVRLYRNESPEPNTRP